MTGIPTVHPQPTEHLPKTELCTLTGHEGAVLAVRFNNTGTYCLSCGKDRTLRLWNPHKGTAIKTYTGHGYDVRDVVVSRENSRLASCGGDRQIFYWDVATGKVIRKFRGHDGIVNSICYGPMDETLVSGGYDQAVRVWDCRSRSFEPIMSMKPFGDSVTTVLLSKTEEIVAGSVDGTVRRFDVRAGCLFTEDLGQSVTSVALSHDNLCILAACLDGRMRLLDKATGTLLAQYKGHKQESIRLECGFSTSDAYTFCGSEDGRVCYYELVEESMVESFQAHAGVVTGLAMHPKGECLLTSSTDGAIKVWQ